jgi:hypothetical protein
LPAVGYEIGTPRCAENRPAALHDSTDISDPEWDKVVGEQASVAVPHAQNFAATRDPDPDYGSDCGVHPGGVAAAGQDRDPFGLHK